MKWLPPRINRSARPIIHEPTNQSSRCPPPNWPGKIRALTPGSATWHHPSHTVPEDPLLTTARITAPLGGHAFHAELPNGKPVVAHLPRSLAHLAANLPPGSMVDVEITPYELDHARIVSKMKRPG